MADKQIEVPGKSLIAEMRAAIALVKRTLSGPPDAEKPPERGSDDLVVKTPSGGIPARSGTTVYAETCQVYGCTGSPASKTATLAAITGYTLPVFNLSNADVGGDRYVVTSRLKSGHRYVVVESCSAD
jgi:hypothetical protein